MHTHTFGHGAMTFESLTARVSPLHLCEFIAIVLPNRGKGGGKSADDEEPTGTDRRLPREPLGPYNRPFPVDGCPGREECGRTIAGKAKAKAKPPQPGFLRS